MQVRLGMRSNATVLYPILLVGFLLSCTSRVGSLSNFSARTLHKAKIFGSMEAVVQKCSSKFGILSCAILVAATCFCSCSHRTSVSGPPDQWIRAKELSVRVSFTEDRVGKIGIRNDSSKEVRVLPMTIRGWYKQYGEKEITMRSGEVETLKPGEQFSMTIPPFLQMDSKMPSIPGITVTDELYKLQVELGPESSREIFAVNR